MATPLPQLPTDYSEDHIDISAFNACKTIAELEKFVYDNSPITALRPFLDIAVTYFWPHLLDVVIRVDRQTADFSDDGLTTLGAEFSWLDDTRSALINRNVDVPQRWQMQEDIEERLRNLMSFRDADPEDTMVSVFGTKYSSDGCLRWSFDHLRAELCRKTSETSETSETVETSETKEKLETFILPKLPDTSLVAAGTRERFNAAETLADLEEMIMMEEQNFNSDLHEFVLIATTYNWPHVLNSLIHADRQQLSDRMEGITRQGIEFWWLVHARDQFHSRPLAPETADFRADIDHRLSLLCGLGLARVRTEDLVSSDNPDIINRVDGCRQRVAMALMRDAHKD